MAAAAARRSSPGLGRAAFSVAFWNTKWVPVPPGVVRHGLDFRGDASVGVARAHGARLVVVGERDHGLLGAGVEEAFVEDDAVGVQAPGAFP